MSSRRIDAEGLVPFVLPSPPVVARSKRSKIVARVFGVNATNSRASENGSLIENAAMKWIDDLLPAPGRIVLITGPSGAGKSSLLRAMKHAAKFNGTMRWLDLSRVCLPERAVIDCFGRKSLVKTLENLSRVGLAEVWTYLHTPAELSEGQRWRLRVALALARNDHARHRTKRTLIVCDEFAAVLDRVSAAVVARTLRRAIDSSSNISAIVATSHEDLLRALQPDVVVRCDFGKTTVEKIRNDDGASSESMTKPE